MAKRWVNRPEGSNWGDFGEDDQLGRLNLLTPQKVREGAAEVREGLAFCLSMPLDFPRGVGLLPYRKGPRLVAMTHSEDGQELFNRRSSMPNSSDVFCDDEVTLCLQYSTQWDAFSHAGQHFDADGDGVAEIVYYNGYRGGEHVLGRDGAGNHVGALKLGIENFAERTIQGRAVMIDVRAYLGDEWRAINFDDLQAIISRDGIEIEPGDMVCLHFGFAQKVLDAGETTTPAMLAQYRTGLDSWDPRVLEWIDRTGIAALISDELAVEALGGAGHGCADHEQAMMPIHELCLFKLGIPLGELWQLTPLANWLRAHGRSRFMLTAPPLRLPRAVGSPANAVGTV